MIFYLGKHVFTEKPTAETTDQINECYTLAEKQGVNLYTGFQRYVHRVMFKIKETD